MVPSSIYGRRICITTYAGGIFCLDRRNGIKLWSQYFKRDFARYESFDTQKEVPAGFLRNPANDIKSLTMGIAFKPIDQIVLKADYQKFDNAAKTGVDQINVLLGYIF